MQKPDEPLPDFRLADIDGDRRSLSERLWGKKGLLLLFAGLRDRLSTRHRLLAMGSEYQKRGIETLVVGVGGRPDDWKRWLRETPTDLPLAPDLDAAVARRYNVRRTPVCFLAYSDRRLLLRTDGIDEKALWKALGNIGLD